MAQQTAMQKLWDWIDANCHEDNFNLNDAREMSLKLEKEQHEMMFNCGRQYQLTGEGTFKQTHEELYGK